LTMVFRMNARHHERISSAPVATPAIDRLVARAPSDTNMAVAMLADAASPSATSMLSAWWLDGGGQDRGAEVCEAGVCGAGPGMLYA